MTTIASVEAFPLPYRETNDHGSIRHTCLVRVEDSDGAVGWGEAATIVAEASLATATLIGGYTNALVGTPAKPAPARLVIARHGWWHGGAGIASFAASAIDMALWDLTARRAGVGLNALLGAPPTASLSAVITCHASVSDLGAMTDEMAGWVASRGAEGIKIAFGKAGESRLGVDLARDVAFIRLLRDAVGDAQIMVDVAPRLAWTLDDALARIRGMAPFGLDWLEEPLGARDDAGYRELHDNAEGVLIAYGEREWNVQGVRDILATDTVDVLGVDPGRLEGVSGFLEAADLCASRGVTANAHAFAGPLIFGASLAVSLASDACTVFELAPARNELYDILGAPELHSSVGPLTWTLDAGLGFSVDEPSVRAAVARNRR